MGLDLPKEKIQHIPAHVKFFENYNIKQIRCGDFHSLLYAKNIKNKKELDQSSVFSIVRMSAESNFCLGLTEE